MVQIYNLVDLWSKSFLKINVWFSFFLSMSFFLIATKEKVSDVQIFYFCVFLIKKAFSDTN